MNVTVEKIAKNITIRDDGLSDVLYLRTIIDSDTNELVLRDAVRETVVSRYVFPEIEKLKNAVVQHSENQ